MHHFARQLASPYPLLAAVGAKTSHIEIGTAVIDMRYENPLYMAEDVGAADIIAGGRLQLGISRGLPEQVIDGWRYFGYQPGEDESEADMARRHTEVFIDVLRGDGFTQPNARPMFPNPDGLLRLEPHSEGLHERIWWGASTNVRGLGRGVGYESAARDAQDRRDRPAVPCSTGRRDTRIPRCLERGQAPRHPRVSVSRSILALVDDRDRAWFGRDRKSEDQIGHIDPNTRSIFGCSYAAEPDRLVEELAKDEAIAEADTLLLTVAN